MQIWCCVAHCVRIWWDILPPPLYLYSFLTAKDCDIFHLRVTKIRTVIPAGTTQYCKRYCANSRNILYKYKINFYIRDKLKIFSVRAEWPLCRWATQQGHLYHTIISCGLITSAKQRRTRRHSIRFSQENTRSCWPLFENSYLFTSITWCSCGREWAQYGLNERWGGGGD